MTQKLVVKFQKLSDKAVGPTRAHNTDAGWDLYYCGRDTQINPQENAKLGTGIKVEIPDGYFLQVENRSGMATKFGVLRGACVSGEQNILTNKGFFAANLLTHDFVKRNGIQIATFRTDTDSIEFVDFNGFSISGKKPIWNIEFEDGTEVEVSEDHLVMNSEKKWMPIVLESSGEYLQAS